MSDPILDALARVRPPADSTPTLPPACYSEAEFLSREVQAVFRRAWIGLGRADRWKVPGDYTALTLAGMPVIVLRDRAGTLRAFANSCRHRGSALLSGEGNTASISCPFHRWTYGLDGTLRGAPEMPPAPVFDKGDYGLVAFHTAEREGFAFLCLDENAPDIDDWLGDFAALHAPWRLSDLVTTRRVELTADCNWKAFLEVFNEYYHLPYVHPDTVANVYAPPEPPEEVSGRYATQFSLTHGTGGLLEETQQHALPAMPWLEGRDRDGTRYSWLFPNMTFAASTEAIWVYEAMPRDAQTCQVTMSVCFPPETIALPDFETKAQAYYDRMDSALAEDLPALAFQQRGLASPHARQGRFCAPLEANLTRFAFWYAGMFAE